MRDCIQQVEALLFSADRPLSVEQMCDVLEGATPEAVGEALAELRGFYEETARAFALVPMAGGHQLLTRPALAPTVERFLVGRRRQRLSRAALEALAIVAYRQPVTRGEVESVRGVDCGATLRTLLERRLVRIQGRARTVGHPLLYATTDHFLEHFGIAELSELPKLEEFAGLLDQDEARAELRAAGRLPAAAAGAAAQPGEDGVAETAPEAAAATQPGLEGSGADGGDAGGATESTLPDPSRGT